MKIDTFENEVLVRKFDQYAELFATLYTDCSIGPLIALAFDG